jgi:hypothetical protein
MATDTPGESATIEHLIGERGHLRAKLVAEMPPDPTRRLAVVDAELTRAARSTAPWAAQDVAQLRADRDALIARRNVRDAWQRAHADALARLDTLDRLIASQHEVVHAEARAAERGHPGVEERQPVQAHDDASEDRLARELLQRRLEHAMRPVGREPDRGHGIDR